MILIMIIFIHKKDTLQIMVTNKQQSPNLGMPVESSKKNIWLIMIYSLHVSHVNIYYIYCIYIYVYIFQILCTYI